MIRSLIVALFLLALVATTLYAGNEPSVEPESVSCHGTVRTESSATGCHGPTAEAGCHGAKTEAKGASSCHGRRQTRIQRAASRQTARQDARDVKRAARASCHGQAKASECDSECECN